MEVEVELSKIIIDEKRQDQVIVLKEKAGERQLPIVIGFLEASSIKMKLTGYDVPRPMTHDLLVSVIEELGATVEKLIVDKLVDNTFHAKLVVKLKDGTEKSIDCRPSDGVAIAVRTDAELYIDDDILKKTSIPKQ